MTEVVAVSSTGPPAAQDAIRALEAGKHVALLSLGVTLAEEVELKRAAAERGLLLLGPGCGTSILAGKGFGIWNSVRRGPIGVVCSSGSGIQEISCLVDKIGISHALGVGPRDMSERVNAAGTLGALKFLGTDNKTKVVVVATRGPTTGVAKRVLGALKNLGKPAVACFLGARYGFKFPKNVISASTLEEAAAHAVALARDQKSHGGIFSLPAREVSRIVEREYSNFGYGQKYIRGLYSGGALCMEAQVILRELVGPVHSNVPLEPRLRLPDPHSSRGHACVDLGAPDLSGGRHPAVDLGPRCERILKEARDWETATILLDVVLGHGAHPDPAGELARAVEEAKRITDRGGGYLSVIASVIGTARDPQNLKAQRKKLEKVGVVVTPSNAQAARMAAVIATKGKAWKLLGK
ncbi:MAG: hypothetical protein QMD00_04545 [Hadesarchaea archaeon]|nr:hypothetical protein [Hadesarchaea archaeon]